MHTLNISRAEIITAQTEQELAQKFVEKRIPSVSIESFSDSIRLDAYQRWVTFFKNPEIFWTDFRDQGPYAEAFLPKDGVFAGTRIKVYAEEIPLSGWESNVQHNTAYHLVRPSGFPCFSFKALAIPVAVTKIWHGSRYPNGEPILYNLYRGRIISQEV